MLGKLFALFVVGSLLELYLLMSVGQLLGSGTTVAVVLCTGLGGVLLARREGFRVLSDWQACMASGEFPADGLTSGLLVVAAGVMLVTPGLITDFVGLAFLVPPVRRALAAVVDRGLHARSDAEWVRSGHVGGRPPNTGRVVEVEATDVADASDGGPPLDSGAKTLR